MDQICPINMLSIFGIHQTIYAALSSHVTELNCCWKSKNFENITFFPKIYNSVTKNPKTLSKSEKCGRREKAIPRTDSKRNKKSWEKTLLSFFLFMFCFFRYFILNRILPHCSMWRDDIEYNSWLKKDL